MYQQALATAEKKENLDIPDTSHGVRREIDLTQEEDLELFLLAVEEVYGEAMQFEQQAESEQFGSLSFDDVTGMEIFLTLNDIYILLKEEIFAYKKTISEPKDDIVDRFIAKMQHLYDSLILLRDYIHSTYPVNNLSTSEPDAIPVPHKTERLDVLDHNVNTARHYVMNIETEDREDSVAIRVTEKTRERIKQNNLSQNGKRNKTQKSSTKSQVVTDTNQKIRQKVIAPPEKKEYVPEAVQAYHAAVMPPKKELPPNSLTAKYLDIPMYRAFIDEVYTSPAAFERVLSSVVAQIEAKSVDVFERWLHEEYNSPFTFLKDKTIREVLELGADAGTRAILMAQNIKYETFLTWIDLISEMQALVSDDLDMTLGELFAKWVIESEMLYVADQLAP